MESCGERAQQQADAVDGLQIGLGRQPPIPRGGAGDAMRSLLRYLQGDLCGIFERDAHDSDGGGGVSGGTVPGVSWPQYRSKDGEAFLRFVLAAPSDDADSIIGWWCLAPSRAEATAASCILRTAVSASEGQVPVGATGRWCVNNGEPAEGGDGGGETGAEELVTLLVTPMREGRELNPAVRKLSAKYLSEQRPAESGHRAGRGRRQPKMQRVRRT